MRTKKPKKVGYQLITATTDSGQAMYRLLSDLIERYHEHLRDARIALAWNSSWKPDADGIVTLGKCRKASDLDRELIAYDFIILLSRVWWLDELVTDAQREALLDHELMHAEVKFDDDGEPALDERGRVVYRIRKHDFEDFACIWERHGMWKSNIEQAARALAKHRPERVAAQARLKVADCEICSGSTYVDVVVDGVPSVARCQCHREAQAIRATAADTPATIQ